MILLFFSPLKATLILKITGSRDLQVLEELGYWDTPIYNNIIHSS